MIDVTQDETYAPGDTIRAVLRFRWDGEFEAVTVGFHRTTFGGTGARTTSCYEAETTNALSKMGGLA